MLNWFILRLSLRQHEEDSQSSHMLSVKYGTILVIEDLRQFLETPSHRCKKYHRNLKSSRID